MWSGESENLSTSFKGFKFEQDNTNSYQYRNSTFALVSYISMDLKVAVWNLIRKSLLKDTRLPAITAAYTPKPEAFPVLISRLQR